MASSFISVFYFTRKHAITLMNTLLGMDERCHWWSAVLAVAAHWSQLTDSDDGGLTDRDEILQRLYAVIDSIPKQSHNAE